jgi:hypothetical protein
VDLEGKLFHFLCKNSRTNGNFGSELLWCHLIIWFGTLLDFFLIIGRREEKFHNSNDSFGFVVDDQLTKGNINFSVGILILGMFFINERYLDINELLGFGLDISLDEFLKTCHFVCQNVVFEVDR